MTNTYVIGLSRSNLLSLEYRFDYKTGEDYLLRITHGLRDLEFATLIEGEETAYKTLQEIKDKYNEVNVVVSNIFEAVVNGNDFDPNQLHIYEVNIGREIY